MWLLESRGGFARHDAPDLGVEIAGDGAETPDLAAPVVTVRFAGYADGRGFSTGNRLRAKGFAGRLIAAGALIPDLARHAFQTGFDAVAVDDDNVARHGEAAWRDAMAPKVHDLYVADPHTRGPEGRGLWARRHNV
jgi:uncharacterized protein (DUF934 family)